MIPENDSNDRGRADLADALSDAARGFYGRGWCVGTSGNFSAVLSDAPLRLLITRSGADKGRLMRDDFVEVDSNGDVVGAGRSSAETQLHVVAAEILGCRSVLHTHSVAATVLGEFYRERGAIPLSGYEMLKGLRGIETHETSIEFPIFPNTQDIAGLAAELRRPLTEGLIPHGFLMAGHGLYTFGTSVADARRQIEILEFLMEVQLHRVSLERR